MNKKIFLFFICAILTIGQSHAQWGRKNYFNVAWVDQTLKNEDNGLQWKSDIGVSLVKGTTYYLHSKPLFGMLKFGIDWTQIDLNYAKLIEDFEIPQIITPDSETGSIIPDLSIPEFNFGKHQLEYSMHIGPSITLNPVDHLKINGYFRYAPSFSGIIYDNEWGDTQFSGAFANFFVTGGAISYKLISLGAEYRWGTGKYNSFSIDTDDITDDTDISDILGTSKSKFKTTSTRLYVSLRF